MKCELNITDNYATMIHFDEMIGLNHFIQLPAIESELPSSYEILLENIAVNLDSNEQPYKELLEISPDNFIKNYTDPVVILKKARLKVDTIKSCKIEMDHKDGEFFHSWKTEFKKNDFLIFCYANSLDYPETFTYVKLVFSGEVLLSFDDEDMLLHSVPYDVCISDSAVKEMNEVQNEKMKLYIKNKIENLKMNNVKSKLWDYDYLDQYFKRNNPFLRYEAFRDYDGTDE